MLANIEPALTSCGVAIRVKSVSGGKEPYKSGAILQKSPNLEDLSIDQCSTARRSKKEYKGKKNEPKNA